MATNQALREYRVNTLPTSGLISGNRYHLDVGNGKYKTFIVSDSLQLIGDAGAEFIEKDTMAQFRNISSREIWAIQQGYYKGVRLNGYYTKGDTPAPIEYYLSNTTDSDDGGSVIEMGGVKFEHIFKTNINPIYFGAISDSITDNLSFLNNTQSACKKYGLKLELGIGKTYYISDTFIIDSFRGGIVSDFAQSFYITSKIKLLQTSSALVTVRVKAQGVTFRNISIEGRGTSVNDSIALQFKIVDEYPSTGTPSEKDSVNNLDCRIDGCIFSAAQTHVEFWGRQVFVSSCSFSGGWNGLRFKEYNTEGLFGGSSRAYRIYNCDFHSFNSGNANRSLYALIVNDTESGYGFHIQDNFSDSFNTFFKGNLVNSQIEGNLTYNLVGWGVLGGIISNSLITNNSFDNAQKYSEGSTNPPYTIQGGVFADSISNSIITNNSFAPCSLNVISSEGVTRSVINGNSISRWGVSSSTPVSAIKLDNYTNTTSKSYSNTIDQNNFFQSFIPESFIIESGTFDMSNYYGNGNRVRVSNGSNVTNVFNTPNSKMPHGITFRRVISSGENINDLTLDINTISGSYSLTNTVSATVIGAPSSDFYGVIHSYVSNIDIVQIAHRIRSNGNQSFIRRISNGVVGSWSTIVQSTTLASTTVKGVVNQTASQANISQADLTAITTPDGSDAATTQALANAIKAYINANVVPLVNAIKSSQNTELTNQRTAGQQAP